MNKLSKDIVISIIFSFLNVLFNFLLIQEAEYTLSVVHLGVFMYIRRIAPTFSNIAQLGTSQALIRFTSIEKENNNKLKNYYFISIILWLVISLVLWCIYFLFREPLSIYFFSNNKEPLVGLQVTFLYINALHLSYIIMPYFLNLRKVLAYNVIQLLVASLVMLIIFKLMGVDDYIQMFYYSLVIIFIILSVLFLTIAVQLKMYELPTKLEIKRDAPSFIRYGFPRAIITFSDMLLLTLGALMIQKDKELIGVFLIGITLSRTILIVLQPVSLLSAVISGHQNSENHYKQVINLLVGGTLYISIIASVLLFNWIDVLLPYWLKNIQVIDQVVDVFKLLSLGLVPYAIFQALKGVIEVKFLKPLNLYSLGVAISSHFVFYFLLKEIYSKLIALSFSLMISFVFLGFFSLYWNKKYLNTCKYFNITSLLILNIFLFFMNFYVHYFYPNLEGFIFSLVLSGVLFLIYIVKNKSLFIIETMNLLKKK